MSRGRITLLSRRHLGVRGAMSNAEQWTQSSPYQAIRTTKSLGTGEGSRARRATWCQRVNSPLSHHGEGINDHAVSHRVRLQIELSRHPLEQRYRLAPALRLAQTVDSHIAQYGVTKPGWRWPLQDRDREIECYLYENVAFLTRAVTQVRDVQAEVDANFWTRVEPGTHCLTLYSAFLMSGKSNNALSNQCRQIQFRGITRISHV